jgi:hypothetical protein
MSWKHEWPLEEVAADDPAPVPANPLMNGSHVAGKAPTRRIFGSLSPVASNHRQTSGIISTSQQGPSADVDSARLENGDAERSPSASNSPHLRTGNGFFVLQQGRHCGQAGKSPPIKMGGRSQGQVHLLAQSIHQRYPKPLLKEKA